MFPGGFLAEIVNSTWNYNGDKNISTVIFDPTLKWGIDKNLDLELTVTPYQIDNSSKSISGIGDTWIKSKWEFFNNNSLGLAISPFVKVPTAHDGLGNGVWEGGVQLPVNWQLNNLLAN